MSEGFVWEIDDPEPDIIVRVPMENADAAVEWLSSRKTLDSSFQSLVKILKMMNDISGRDQHLSFDFKQEEAELATLFKLTWA